MEVNNEADRIKRKIYWKNFFIFLLVAVALALFLNFAVTYDTIEDKMKLFSEIAIPVCVVLSIIIAYTQKKDRKAWEEAEKYFHPDNNVDVPKSKLDELRDKNKKLYKINGSEEEQKDENSTDAESKDKTSEEVIGNKKDVLSNSGRVTGIGEYKFTPPGGKQKKDDFHKFNTGVRSDSTLTGQTGSILDRYK